VDSQSKYLGDPDPDFKYTIASYTKINNESLSIAGNLGLKNRDINNEKAGKILLYTWRSAFCRQWNL
jgi:hypothetical protein